MVQPPVFILFFSILFVKVDNVLRCVSRFPRKSLFTPSALKPVSLCNGLAYNNTMSIQNDQKVDLLSKTADYYRMSIANYGEFVKKERKPRTKKQLEQRLQVILNEIDSLKVSEA